MNSRLQSCNDCKLTVLDWMQYGKNADFNAVWVPLSEENAAIFDETKAWAFIEEHLGIDYGWQNVLTGWLVCISEYDKIDSCIFIKKNVFNSLF